MCPYVKGYKGVKDVSKILIVNAIEDNDEVVAFMFRHGDTPDVNTRLD